MGVNCSREQCNITVSKVAVWAAEYNGHTYRCYRWPHVMLALGRHFCLFQFNTGKIALRSTASLRYRSKANVVVNIFLSNFNSFIVMATDQF